MASGKVIWEKNGAIRKLLSGIDDQTSGLTDSKIAYIADVSRYYFELDVEAGHKAGNVSIMVCKEKLF